MSAFVNGDANIRRNLTQLPGEIAAAVERGVSAGLMLLSAHIVDAKLKGQVLRRQSGNLASSVAASPRVVSDGDRAIGFVGTSVWYGLAHEYGGAFTEQIPEHLAKISQAFGRAIPEKTITVHAHQRTVNLPERSFLRSSLEELEASGALSDAVRTEVWRALDVAR